jgi:hypothetical protein
MKQEKQLQELFGKHFFQWAFYCDNRQQNNIGKYWIKVETDLDGEYKAWQVRDVKSLEEGWKQLIKKIKNDRRTNIHPS